jgi:hypothetical protein
MQHLHANMHKEGQSNTSIPRTVGGEVCPY